MDQTAIEDNELVIVGSRYKDLADVFCEYYETGKPLEHDDLVRILGSDRVMLLPVRNTYDYYAVEVRTTDRKLLAHIWMYQSYAVREWMNDHEMKCMQARVTRINTRYGLIFAEPVDAADLVISGRCNINIDESWARGLPDFYQSNDSQSLNLSIYMLHDELLNAEGWNDRLETRMLNLLQDLLSDLSAEYYDECMALYYMMKHSPIAGIREQSDRLLDGYVRRASIDNMTWWRRVWLPQYIQDVAESDVPRMFELAGYDLQSVEALLHRAPEGLSYLYEANPERFAYHLYYSTLSRDVYTRLLTLIAVREVMREKGENDIEGLANVVPSGCFKFTSEFTKQKVDTIVKKYYHGSYADLALIEIALYDHGQLEKRNAHTPFIKALVAMGSIKQPNDIVFKQIRKGITDKFRRLPELGYKEWDNIFLNEKTICISIGRDLGETMPYTR